MELITVNSVNEPVVVNFWAPLDIGEPEPEPEGFLAVSPPESKNDPPESKNDPPESKTDPPESKTDPPKPKNDPPKPKNDPPQLENDPPQLENDPPLSPIDPAPLSDPVTLETNLPALPVRYESCASSSKFYVFLSYFLRKLLGFVNSLLKETIAFDKSLSRGVRLNRHIKLEFLSLVRTNKTFHTTYLFF